MTNEQHDLGLLVLGFRRAKFFEAAVRSLRNLGLPSETPVYAVIDGPRFNSELEVLENKEVQTTAEKLLAEGLITHLVIRPENLGTKTNVYKSVSEVLSIHEYVFVLEDDLKILEIAKGSTQILINKLSEDVPAFGLYCNRSFVNTLFLSNRFSSQGWGTSREAWSTFDPEAIQRTKYSRGFLKELRKKAGGDLVSDLAAFQSGRLDSWAVPWNVHNFMTNKTMIYPPASYIENNSHMIGAERTFGIEFKHEISKLPLSEFADQEPLLNKKYLRHHGLFARMKRRLLSLFHLNLN
jgi:hypothetical protein